ncbi:hypothetical protein F53441_14627 [Fusarium austroafricanum]|uniref:HTH CENPB-type domain-containing protein n=1 Tax=Fusarium austroafricanum TaxID=2364996 RepID=A0A8H4JBV6_9HYPO|nr:hypothetical protein F53441_14627 [Fusarium austroafricanum]
MPRECNDTEEEMQRAREAAKDSISLVQAEKTFGIPRETLRGRLNGAVRMTDAMAAHQRLFHSQEERLSEWMCHVENHLHARLTDKDLVEFAGKILVDDGEPDALKPFGKNWAKSFLRRVLKLFKKAFFKPAAPDDLLLNSFESSAIDDHSKHSTRYECKNASFPPPPLTPSAEKVLIQGQSTTVRENRKPGFSNRLHDLSAKIAGPVNGFANKLGCETFMPTSLDKECDKAARILTSFCDGTPLAIDSSTSPNESLSKRKAIVKIPRQVIKSATGLAIFTAFRSGTQFSWGSGSGVVVVRRTDGSWSPPSSFAVNTLSVGFMFAMDIYDCVCVLRTAEAVAAFTKPRVSFGSEVAVTAGPVGNGVYVDWTVSSDGFDKPIWSYVKSRGLYIGAQIDGTIITTRGKANEDFYGVEVPVASILHGMVPARGHLWPEGYWGLNNVLREIDSEADQEVTGATGPEFVELARRITLCSDVSGLDVNALTPRGGSDLNMQTCAMSMFSLYNIVAEPCGPSFGKRHQLNGLGSHTCFEKLSGVSGTMQPPTITVPEVNIKCARLASQNKYWV